VEHFVKHQVPILPVHDVQATLDYYRDHLGCQVAWKWEEGYGAVYCGDDEVHFDRCDGPVHPQTLYWFVEDAEAVYQEFIRNAVAIVEPLESRAWGMKEFVARDLNGHLLRVGHGERTVDEIPSFSKPG
jgi:uncharacterized glyoxalase superfamily protein PhnB